MTMQQTTAPAPQSPRPDTPSRRTRRTPRSVKPEPAAKRPRPAGDDAPAPAPVPIPVPVVSAPAPAPAPDQRSDVSSSSSRRSRRPPATFLSQRARDEYASAGGRVATSATPGANVVLIRELPGRLTSLHVILLSFTYSQRMQNVQHAKNMSFATGRIVNIADVIREIDGGGTGARNEKLYALVDADAGTIRSPVRDMTNRDGVPPDGVDGPLLRDLADLSVSTGYKKDHARLMPLSEVHMLHYSYKNSRTNPGVYRESCEDFALAVPPLFDGDGCEIQARFDRALYLARRDVAPIVPLAPDAPQKRAFYVFGNQDALPDSDPFFETLPEGTPNRYASPMYRDATSIYFRRDAQDGGSSDGMSGVVTRESCSQIKHRVILSTEICQPDVPDYENVLLMVQSYEETVRSEFGITNPWTYYNVMAHNRVPTLFVVSHDSRHNGSNYMVMGEANYAANITVRTQAMPVDWKSFCRAHGTRVAPEAVVRFVAFNRQNVRGDKMPALRARGEEIMSGLDEILSGRGSLRVELARHALSGDEREALTEHGNSYNDGHFNPEVGGVNERPSIFNVTEFEGDLVEAFFDPEHPFDFYAVFGSPTQGTDVYRRRVETGELDLDRLFGDPEALAEFRNAQDFVIWAVRRPRPQ